MSVFKEWHPKWPEPGDIERVMASRLLYRPPPGLRLRAKDFEPKHVEALCAHLAWRLWIWHPKLDWVNPPSRVNPDQWLNAVLTPLHGRCLRAIRQTLDAPFLHRVNCGEVQQSPRARYYGDPRLNWTSGKAIPRSTVWDEDERFF